MSSLFYFSADATRYCMAGEVVKRIVWLPALSSLDGVPAWFLGVLNLHGERIAVIDFSVWMGHAARPYSVKQKLLILKNGDVQAAIVVDEVEGLEEWSGEILSMEQSTDNSLLLGQVRDGDDIVMLVNAAALIASSQRWPLQDLRAAHMLQANSVSDAVLLQSRMHQLAKEAVSVWGGMLLQFAIVSTGQRRYAIALDQIMEFCLFKQFTYLPGSPAAMLGCMNLRGEIIAILDLGILLGLDPSPPHAQLMVLQHEGQKFSCLIQSIECLVVATDSNVIEMPDQDDQHPLSDTLLRDKGEVTPILNLEAVLALFKPQPLAYANH